MPPQDVAAPRAESPQALHPWAFAHRQHQSAHRTGRAHPGENGQDQHQLPQSFTPQGSQDHQYGQRGNRKQDIHSPHDQHVHSSANVARRQPEPQPQQRGHRGGADADDQRRADTADQQGKDIPSPLVGPQKALPRAGQRKPQAGGARTLKNQAVSAFRGKERFHAPPDQRQAESLFKDHIPGVQVQPIHRTARQLSDFKLARRRVPQDFHRRTRIGLH